jgi:hypothetical protein
MAAAVRDRLDYIPAWGEFRLRQPNADGFTIRKRTASGHGWVPVDACRTRGGLGYVGCAGRWRRLAMYDFWRRCPVGLDVAEATGEAARFTLRGITRPTPRDGPALLSRRNGDDRFARQNEGLDITYEDYEPGWGDARGIARTTEFRLWALDTTPTRERLIQMAAQVEAPPAARDRRSGSCGGRVRCLDAGGTIRRRCGRTDRGAGLARAGFLHRASRAAALVRLLDYGDVMHSYDADRHVWRYDIGGFAG